MFRNESSANQREIAATTGAVGASITLVLLGLSVVLLALRKVRLTVDVNQDKDLKSKREHSGRIKGYRKC